MLQAFGLDVRSSVNLEGSGLSNIIEFDYHGNVVPLGIGSGCSGLYSVGLFFSAFIAFVIVRYRRVDRYVMLALLIGLVLTWLSNIIRMALTIYVGSIWGAPALATFHSYIGIVVFVVIIAFFWIFLVRWLDKVEQGNTPLARTTDPETPYQ
jgi:exosortase/archaeosortase family protein